MALRPILHYPDPRLRNRAERVTEIDDDVRELVADMFETMYGAPGIGLAATQINVHKRILVLDVSAEKDTPMCLINPEIIAADGEEETEEGCLSVPGVFESVRRAERITYRGITEQNVQIEDQADGLLAVCIQHEIDHLDGKLFVDYLSQLKRIRIRKKLEKTQKQED